LHRRFSVKFREIWAKYPLHPRKVACSDTCDSDNRLDTSFWTSLYLFFSVQLLESEYLMQIA